MLTGFELGVHVASHAIRCDDDFAVHDFIKTIVGDSGEIVMGPREVDCEFNRWIPAP
jgi:hypothetical protein